MLYKRRKTWHADFVVSGRRYRQSLHTRDWREAQAKEKALIALASEGKLAQAGQSFSKLNITEAIERYLADRAAQFSREASAPNPIMPNLSGNTSDAFRSPGLIWTPYWPI
jgi:hypothetical protein